MDCISMLERIIEDELSFQYNQQCYQTKGDKESKENSERYQKQKSLRLVCQDGKLLKCGNGSGNDISGKQRLLSLFNRECYIAQVDRD
jgi:hypothetical protein